jgi:hypothetical protein
MLYNISILRRYLSLFNHYVRIRYQHSFKTIPSTWTRDVLKAVRKLENIEKKIARWKNHRLFNIRCLRVDIIPASIRLDSTVRGRNADKIIHNTERKLLNERIKICEFTIKKLSGEKAAIVLQITTVVSTNTMAEVEVHIAQAQKAEFDNTKTRQRRKFDSLVNKRKAVQMKLKEQTNAKSSVVDKNRWVMNVSSKELSDTEVSVLKKGLNFAITPKKMPIKEVITSTETACYYLRNPEIAQSLRGEVVKVLKSVKMPKSNCTREEIAAINTIKRDDSIRVLPADKGKATVIMNKSDYDKKIDALLADEKTYQKLKKDPTKKYKQQLVDILRVWNREDNIPKDLYHRIYPTSEEVPKFYGLPKIHKKDTPLRPIVSSIGSITYHASKHLADMLAPIVGKTEHHIKNSVEFAKTIEDLEVSPVEKLVSYDVTALFTSIPVPKAIEVIRAPLEQDATLYERSVLSVDQLMVLLEFVLNTTYFMFQGAFYKQTHGAAMGSPVSPIVANLYMEYFEQRALTSTDRGPSLWFRYVDDTFTKLLLYDIEHFTDHINALDDNIKFTSELEVDGQLAFLDTCVNVEDDGSTRITIYRKPTHTDQYLNFNSNHHLEHKRSVVRSLVYRAEHVVTEVRDREKETRYIRSALSANDFPNWALNIPEPKAKTDVISQSTSATTSKISIPIPYVQGVSKHIKRVFDKHGVRVYHKPVNTIRQQLVHPKDPTPIENKCGVVYKIKCDNCEHNYIALLVKQRGPGYES